MNQAILKHIQTAAIDQRWARKVRDVFVVQANHHGKQGKENGGTEHHHRGQDVLWTF
jgi:hypothetical protein